MSDTTTRAAALLLTLAIVATLTALTFSPCAEDPLWRGFQFFFGLCRYGFPI